MRRVSLAFRYVFDMVLSNNTVRRVIRRRARPVWVKKKSEGVGFSERQSALNAFIGWFLEESQGTLGNCSESLIKAHVA
jgi:epoxyqueuosine reductase QueG